MIECCLTICDNEATDDVTFPDTGDTYPYCRSHSWPYRSVVVTPIRRTRRAP